MAYLLAFILGALTLPLLPSAWLPPVFTLWAAVVVAALLSYFLSHKPLHNPLMARLCLQLTLLLLGASVAHSGVSYWVERQIEEVWHGQDVQLEGRVIALIDTSPQMHRFHLRVDHARPGELSQVLRGQLVRLSWYYGETLVEDEQWRLTVRLKRPRGFVNPRGFDYGAWLLSQELVATGYVKNGRRLAGSSDHSSLNTWRRALAQHLFSDGLRSTGFFQALLLGDKSSINAAEWRVLQRTGTIHLMAISGLHVGLVAGLGYLLGWLLVRGLALSPLPVRTDTICRLLPPLVSSLLALLYSALAGFSIPTQRAMIAVFIANLALMLGVRVSPLRVLAWACVLVLVTSPLAPTQNGFWLSFGAVLVLVIGFAGRGRPSAAPALLKVQALLAVGLLAPLLALGQVVSLVGPVANLLAVPLVSLVIVPGLLLAAALTVVSPGLGALVVAVLDHVFQWLWVVLSWLSGVGFAQWWPAFPTTTAALVLLALASLLIVAPRGLYLRALGGALAACVLLAPRTSPPPLTVAALEVGQGLAVWIRTAQFNLLYDTGPAFSSDFDAGSRIVAPFLKSQGVRRLDTVVVSHGDGDHSGGLAGLLEHLLVEQLLVSDSAMRHRYPSADLCQQGARWRWSPVEFEILWPVSPGLEEGNNSSCVLLVRWGEHSILLAGDIDARVERQLIAEGRLPRQLSLLVAPHHGSRSSSSEALVQYTRPQAVVFSAGYQNRYGHPADEVVARYAKAGSSIYNTAEQGAITFAWWQETGVPQVDRARERIGRAWY